MSPPDPQSATVDAAACVVHVDGQRRPFSIDLATGAVTLGSGVGATTIEPLTWREKLTLARFGRAEGRLLDSALIAHKLMGDDDRPVLESAEGRALVALARWVNGFGPHGGAAPLEPRLLARIGARARRAGELSPADLDRMPAVEVELLADALATADPRSERGPEDDDGVTRILVVPDPGPGEPAFDDDQVDAATVLAATVPAATVPAATVPAATVPAGTVPAATVPAATVPAATVPAATVPRPGDLPYLGSAPLSAGRSAPDRPGPARAGGADHPPPARRPDPALRPMPTETGPVPAPAPDGRGDGHGDSDTLRPWPMDGHGSPAADRSAGPRSEPPLWSPVATAPRPRAAHPRRATAPVLPVLPVLPAPNPIAARPADPITVPASPAPFTAPAAPGARPAPAGAEIDRVLDELAHRLEQAVEDLGLDGEG
jgi:hypothetical protein